LPGVLTRDFIRQGVADELAELASSSRTALLEVESAKDVPTDSDSNDSVENGADNTFAETVSEPTDADSLARALAVIDAHALKPLHSVAASRSAPQVLFQDATSSSVVNGRRDLHEIIICQAQFLHDRLVTTDAANPDDGSAGNVLSRLQHLSQQLTGKSVTAEDMRVCAKDLSQLLASADGVTCYEMTQSGLVGSLASVLNKEPDVTCKAADGGDFGNVLAGQLLAQRTASEVDINTPTAFEVLVLRLHEALCFAENLKVCETHRLASGELGTPANMLTKQIRFSVVPASKEYMVALTEAAGSSQAAKEASATMDRMRQSFRAITVSVHAVAPFSVIEAYLRPRVSLFVGKRPRHSPQHSVQSASDLIADDTACDNERGTERRPQQAQVEPLPASAVASGSRHGMRRSGAGQVGKQHLRMLQMIAQSSGIDLHAAGLLGDHELSDSDDDDDDNSGSSSEALSISPQSRQYAEKQGKDEGTTCDKDRAGPSTATASDWRLVFKLVIGGTERAVESSDNIFQTIHSACQSSDTLRDTSPWTQTFQLQFHVEFGKQCPSSPPPLPLPSLPTHSAAAKQELSAVFGERSAAIIDVIKLLHDRLSRAGFGSRGADGLPAEIFANRKLAAKVTRQLDDPLLVVCSALPNWCHLLIRHAPFLVSFDARVAYLQATSFGYSRNISRWQTIAQREARNGSRPAPDTQVPLGRMQRQKVRISRNRMLDSALKVLDLYGSVSSVLEVEYFEEVGTGLGPTLEFYSTVSRCLQERSLSLWRETSNPDFAKPNDKELQPEY
ncbi:Ubiquitin fusion degradation protein 4, partial [Coemansia aciculifera]